MTARSPPASPGNSVSVSARHGAHMWIGMRSARIETPLAFGREREKRSGRRNLDIDFVVVRTCAAPSIQVTAGRTGDLASPSTNGRPLTKPTSIEALLGAGGACHLIGNENELAAGSSKSTSRMVTCSPLGPEGMVRSPRTQPMNSSLERTKPSPDTPRMTPRELA